MAHLYSVKAVHSIRSATHAFELLRKHYLPVEKRELLDKEKQDET
jgi:hypothetical protein